jgi:prenyltransferase beta subunit
VELKMPREKYVEPAVKFLVSNAKSFEEIRIAAAGLEAVDSAKSAPPAWMDMLGKMRKEDGSYGQARDTAGAMVTVLRLGGKVEAKDGALKAIRAGQLPDGGFGKDDAKKSDLETSYRVMRGFHMLKERPSDVKALREFVAKCRNDDGGFGVAPGEPSSASGTYFAGIILHWLD